MTCLRLFLLGLFYFLQITLAVYWQYNSRNISRCFLMDHFNTAESYMLKYNLFLPILLCRDGFALFDPRRKTSFFM